MMNSNKLLKKQLGSKKMKHYKEVFNTDCWGLNEFVQWVNSLNNESRRVIGYQVTPGRPLSEVVVTFADLTATENKNE